MFELSVLNWLTTVAWTTVLLWLVGAILTLRGIQRQQPLSAVPAVSAAAQPAGDTRTPFVSILVPARNEADRILEQAVRSMLAQDYPQFEVIAVDDRSTDTTKSILDKIAAGDERLRVIEGQEPPTEWLGKPHAMQQAFDGARGSWILATDADMIFAKEALKTSIVHAQNGSYDAVTLLPRVECRSFWERVFMPTFGWFMLVARPLERVNDPSRREAIGIGGFFLIRRAALIQIGGYNAVRGEVAEDLRMAELLKESGARLRLEYAPDLVATRMQTNLPEIWEGFTKNLFAGARFKLLPALVGGIAVLTFAVAPIFVAIGCSLTLASAGAHELVRLIIPAALVWMIQVATFAVINRAWGIPLSYALAVPLGHALFVAILFNSVRLILSGRGVRWKDRTLYARGGGVRPPRESSNKIGKSFQASVTDE